MRESSAFDDSLWPLLIFRISGAVSDMQYEAILERSTAYLERGEKYVSISDIRHASLFSATQRNMQVEWLRKHEAGLRERILGNATIITSAPLRLSLSLILHIRPMPMPNAVVSDMDSALKYVLGRLAEGGLASKAERIRRHLSLSAMRAG